MQMYELSSLLKYSYIRDKENWEQARLIAYVIAQTNNKKKLSQTDILTFGWEDNNSKTIHNTSISSEDIQRLKEQAEKFKDIL